MVFRKTVSAVAAMLMLASAPASADVAVATSMLTSNMATSAPTSASSYASPSLKSLSVLSEKRPVQLAPAEVEESEDLLATGKTLLSAEQAFKKAHSGQQLDNLDKLAEEHFPVPSIMPDPRVSTYAYNFAVNVQGVWEARLRLGNAKICERIAGKASREREMQSHQLGAPVARTSSALDCITQSGAIYFVVRDLSSLPFHGAEDVRTETADLLDKAQRIVGAAEVLANMNQKTQPVDIATLQMKGLLVDTLEPNPVVSSHDFSLSLSDDGEYVVKLPLDNTRVCAYISSEAAKARARGVASHLSKDVPYDCVTHGQDMTFYMHS
jgi:hypothetical protein